MESGVLRGFELTPKEVLQNFLGGGSATSCGGSNALTPRQIQPCMSGNQDSCQSNSDLLSSNETPTWSCRSYIRYNTIYIALIFPQADFETLGHEYSWDFRVFQNLGTRRVLKRVPGYPDTRSEH